MRPKWCRGGKREAILGVARQVFSEDGYSAASMSHIAARLGGSKGTLYNYFRSKEELFEAHIQDRCSGLADAIFDAPLEQGDTGKVLTALAERMLTLLLSDESTAFYRQVVSEAARNPAIGKAFYENGPKCGIGRVAEVLERARADGQIFTDDCAQAAEEFLSLLHGGLHLKRMLNIIGDLTPDEIRADAARLTRLFMRAYGRPENAAT